MKIEEFLLALVAEIDGAAGDIGNWSAVLAGPATDDAAFMEALEAYSGQLERLGETSTMLGLNGLAGWCTHYAAGLMGIAQVAPAERTAHLGFLAAWPDRWRAWLAAPAGFEESMALAEHLAQAPAGCAPAEEASLALMEQLMAPPELPAELAAAAEEAIAEVVVTEADVSLELADTADPDVYAAFIDEAADNATALSTLMFKMADGAASAEDMVNAKRIAHSFKGSANIVGIRGIASMAHQAEDLLEVIERDPANAPQPVKTALADAAACIEQMVYALMGEEEAPANAFEILQRVTLYANAARRGELAQVASANQDSADSPSHDSIDSAPPDSAGSANRYSADSAALGDAASGSDVKAFSAASVAPEASDDRAPQAVTAAAAGQDAIYAGADRRAGAHGAPSAAPVRTSISAGDARAPGGVAAAGAANLAPEEKESTLRVPARAVDELLRLVGELTVRLARMDDQTRRAVRGAADLAVQNHVLLQKIDDLDKLVTIRGMAFRADEAGPDGAANADPLELEQYNELYGVSRAVQEAASDSREMGQALRTEVMTMERELELQARLGRSLAGAVVGVRMLPMSNLFPRLARTVRQTVTATSRQADFVSAGGDIMIDSDMLAALADPLLHVLRNAVDHGIEAPAARRAAGKPETGTISINVTRVGNSVTVRVTDDGAGLNYPAIRAKAVERGLVGADAPLTEAELAQLILLPGFSTRAQVSEVSGRGVGMDVVASRMRGLNGTLGIRSTPGDGCVIELRFQASLVSQHALLVQAGGQMFALPSHLIVIGVPAGGSEITQDGAALLVQALGEPWTVRSLAAIAGFSAPPDAAALASQSFVLFRSAGQAYALAVERIAASRELIIQPLPQVLKFLRGVSGAAILGDGAVAPLLDPAELAAQPLAGLGISQARIAEMAQAARQQARRVVVVDDSLSARKAVVQLLRDSGYEVAEAVDGLAAIPMIVKLKPFAVVTDLEMPNMNGVELTRYLRADAAMAQLPVVMITSRTMARHREMAREAGVSVYLTKPYSDAQLLGALSGFDAAAAQGAAALEVSASAASEASRASAASVTEDA